jgi:uncharacterized protein
MQFIPIVERVSTQATADGLSLVSPEFIGSAKVTPWSVQPQQYGRFLCGIFDEWVRNDVGTKSVQIFEESLRMWAGYPASLCVFREECGDALAIEHSGDVYSCDHFVYPEHRLGNILESPLASLAGSEQQLQFGKAKVSTLPRYCHECDVRFACKGECPKHRFMTTPDGEPGLNYLCAAYKMFFRHIDPYMKFMAGELAASRSPENVMAWTHQRDVAINLRNIGRNDPCPCGSGRKSKHCCLRNRP